MNRIGTHLIASAIALGTGLLAGCGTTTNSGYTTTYDQYGRPVYTQTQTAAGVNSYGQPVDAYGNPVYAGNPAYSQPMAAGNGFVGGGDYIYYPDSEVYYSAASGDYVYWDGGRWSHHHQPPRTWNRSSVSVHLNFGNDPWDHHNDVIRRYPRNWNDRDRRWDRDRDRDHDRDHDGDSR